MAPGMITISALGLADNGAAAQTIAAPVALGAPQTWTINGTQPLTVSGGDQRGHEHGA